MRHFHYHPKALPQLADSCLDFYNGGIGAPQRHKNPQGSRKDDEGAPQPWGFEQVCYRFVATGILVQETQYRRFGDKESSSGNKKDGESIRQTIGNHRTEYRCEGGMLTSGYISCSPHFSQAGKYEIYGISTENTVYQSNNWRSHAKGIQLKPPTIRPEYVRTYSYQKSGGNPTIVALLADNSHHLLKIYAGKKQIT